MLIRKYLLLVCLSLALADVVHAQFKLGFQFSPTLSTNRINADSDSLTLNTDGAGLRVAFGPIIDVPIQENYFFSSGLLFVSKRAGIEAIREGNNPGIPTRETYGLQYLQVPLSLKLLTNEVALDKKIYFQFGTTLEFNIQEEPNENDHFLLEDFRLFDSSLLAAVGVEYEIGLNTTLFGGFSYHRGLINAVSGSADVIDDIRYRNDYLGLDIGVKF